MLSLNHSYAHQHVRNALNDETHHIKVSDETGGEVYDVTLNSTEPFATPRVSTPVSSNPKGSADQSSANEIGGSSQRNDATSSRGIAAGTGTGGVTSQSPPPSQHPPSSPPLHSTPSSPPILKPLQLVSKIKSDHSRTISNGNSIPRSSSPVPQPSNSKSFNTASDSQQQYTAPPRRHAFLSSELPPSPPLEPDMEMQYRNVNGNSGEIYTSPNHVQGYGGMQDSSSGNRTAQSSNQMSKPATEEGDFYSSKSNGNQVGGDASIPIYPQRVVAGPTSSPPTSSLNTYGHLQSTSDSSSHSTNLKRPSPADRRNMSASAASTNTTGTTYATASEDEGEDEMEAVQSFKSPQSTYMTANQAPPSRQSTLHHTQPSVLLVPTTAEPASFLHQPEASTSALVESISPSQPQRIQPSRRATTGTAGSPRPPSASSVGTQRSSRELSSERQKSKERSNSIGPGLFGNAVPAAAAALGFSSGPPASFYEEHGSQPSNLPASGASTSATHLERTGDADFDEDWLKNIELKKRERQYKRQKEAEAVAQAQAQLQQQPGLNRGKSDVQGVDAPGASAGAALAHVETRDDSGGDPKVIKGKLIGEDHVNYVLMYNMLTGIRIGVSRCQAKVKRPLTDADYSAKHKFTFDIIGNELTPSAKYDFKFKDYAPWVFRELRECFQLDPADYLLSLTAKYILSELGSPGKSGSFFYFSRDYRFIIKTIRHGEHKFFLKILKDYHAHVKANPHTLLSRFYGLHRVKLPRGRKIHFVIMNNLFPPHRDIHETYDLKGSAIGREYPEDLVEKKKGAAVMKDLNWLNRNREIELGPEKRILFDHQLKKDVELLQRLNIMDYSLLIGLHDMSKGNSQNLRQDKLQVFQPGNSNSSDSQTNNNNTNQHLPTLPGLRRIPTQKGKRISEADAFALRQAIQSSDPKSLSESGGTRLPDRDVSERRHFIFYQDEGGIRSTDENNVPTGWIYYLNVIDLFTPYNSVKRAEHYWKGLTNDSKMISSVHPVQYGNRFYNFLMSVVTGGDKSKRPKMK